MLWRLFILLSFAPAIYAQPFNAAPLLAMGNTGLALQSPFSLTNNPAGIATLARPHIGLAYQNHFLSTEIQSQAAFATLPFGSSNAVGVSMNNYGLKEVSRFLTLRAAYAKRFGTTFATSISVNYHRYYVRHYHSEQVASLDLGLQYYVSDKVVLGVLARNATSSVFSDETLQYIPEEYGIGLAYEVSKQTQLSSDIYYDVHQGFNFRGGLAYWFEPRFVIRGGVASHPMQYFAGAGLHLQKLQIDIASSFHPRLGSSPQLAISYEL